MRTTVFSLSSLGRATHWYWWADFNSSHEFDFHHFQTWVKLFSWNFLIFIIWYLLDWKTVNSDWGRLRNLLTIRKWAGFTSSDWGRSLKISVRGLGFRIVSTSYAITFNFSKETDFFFFENSFQRHFYLSYKTRSS